MHCLLNIELLDIELLMDGHEQLPESLFRHSAKFHKSCKLKFGQVKLDRAIKQSSHSSSPLQSPTSSEALRTTPRRQNIIKSPTVETCFFCNMTSDPKASLHLVQSFRLDQRVRRCTNILEDSHLHAKLQDGDMIAQARCTLPLKLSTRPVL